MKSSFGIASYRLVPVAVRATLVFAVAVTFASFAERAWAADQLAYSFESDEDGFVQNPSSPGITATQDTIGATLGTHSLKVSVVGGATFVGVLTPNLPAGVFGDPPGMDHVTFDLTIPSQFPGPDPNNPGQPLPGFGVIGVTVFGMSQPDYPGGPFSGLQAQFFDGDPMFNNEEHIDGLAPGTYKNFRIDLTSAPHPLTFALHQNFNQIFGTLGSGQDDVIPTSFQFYVNKTGGAAYPVTFYIDNVRFGTTVPGDYNGNGVVDTADYVLWRRGGPLVGEIADPGTVSQADYVAWRARFGATSGAGGGASIAPSGVPEPATAALLIIASAWSSGFRRRRSLCDSCTWSPCHFHYFCGGSS